MKQKFSNAIQEAISQQFNGLQTGLTTPIFAQFSHRSSGYASKVGLTWSSNPRFSRPSIVARLPLVILAATALVACKQEDDQIETLSDPDVPVFEQEIFENILNLPETPFNYSNIDLPDHFLDNDVLEADNTPGNNPITDAGATLGRVLFYDTQLSQNNSISCASCHAQEAGFSDPRQFSVGFEGGLTGRNSMGLANARYYEPGHFFWDERANTLEDQVLGPIQDAVEMGLTLAELEQRLQDDEHYQELFALAFGDNVVTSERISLALSQFIRAMVSYQSRYDVAVANGNGGQGGGPGGGPGGGNLIGLTAQENLGRQIFFRGGNNSCASCHDTDLFIAEEATNNGLDLVFADNGVGAVTGNPNDNGKFKVPSLRNIEVTGPYMHDGRFATLEQVVDFYNTGVQAHPNLDQRMRGPGGQPRRLNLDAEERAALVAFMRTFTDNAFLQDEKFSDPFINNQAASN